MVVPLLAWYFLINIGCGTGNKPTRVLCWRNLPKINDSPEIGSEPHGGATVAWYFLINIGCGTGNKPTRVLCWRNLPKIHNSPEIGSEPHGGATVGLVLPDQYWMWYW